MIALTDRYFPRHWDGTYYLEPASEDGPVQHPRPLYLGKHLDVAAGSDDAHAFVRYRTGWLAR